MVVSKPSVDRVDVQVVLEDGAVPVGPRGGGIVVLMPGYGSEDGVGVGVDDCMHGRSSRLRYRWSTWKPMRWRWQCLWLWARVEIDATSEQGKVILRRCTWIPSEPGAVARDVVGAAVMFVIAAGAEQGPDHGPPRCRGT